MLNSLHRSCRRVLAASFASALTVFSLTAQAQQAARVEVAAVIEAPLQERITLSGGLRSPSDSALNAQVSGHVTAVAVQAGDRVEQGQLLVSLDDTLPQLELQRLEATLEEAKALLADQRRRAREASNLASQNSFSRSELESLEAEVAARQARATQVEAQTIAQRTRVDYHSVEAPFAGVVTQRLVEVGQQVSGTTPLLRLASMDPVWAEVQLPEQYLSRIQQDAPLRVQIPALQNAWIDARVSRIVPVSTGTARTFLVRAELANTDWQLAPGMTIRMELGLGSGANTPTLQVPVDAITRQPDGSSQVWVVTKEGSEQKAQARKVATGHRTGATVEVISDALKAGDKVVIRGNENLQAGQSVLINGEPGGR